MIYVGSLLEFSDCIVVQFKINEELQISLSESKQFPFGNQIAWFKNRTFPDITISSVRIEVLSIALKWQICRTAIALRAIKILFADSLTVATTIHD